MIHRVHITVDSIAFSRIFERDPLILSIGITDQQRETIILELIGSMSTVQAVKMVDQINKEIGE